MDISSTTTEDSSSSDSSSEIDNQSSYDTESTSVCLISFLNIQDSSSTSSDLQSGPVSDGSTATEKQSTSRYSMRDNRPVFIPHLFDD